MSIILPEPQPEVIYCHAQTYASTRDSPAEFCTEEVADWGDMCETHDEQDRADAAYEQWKDSRYDD